MAALAPVLPFLPAIIGVGSAGASYLQGEKQSKRADKAQDQAQQFYAQTSLPQPAAVEAQQTQNRGQLGQDRLGAYQSLSKNLASRGFGSGSGLGIKGATDIESSYVKSLGQSATDLTKFSNTRQFAPGPDAYGYSVPGGGEQMLGSGGNMLNSALGMYMASKAFGGGFNWGGGQQGGGQLPTGIPGAGQDYDWKTGRSF
jgi:hypothetical protein